MQRKRLMIANIIHPYLRLRKKHFITQHLVKVVIYLIEQNNKHAFGCSLPGRQQGLTRGTAVKITNYPTSRCKIHYGRAPDVLPHEQSLHLRGGRVFNRQARLTQRSVVDPFSTLHEVRLTLSPESVTLIVCL